MVLHGLRTFQHFDEPPNQKKQEDVYRKLYNGWTGKIDQLGRLGGNHVIAVAAVVGLVPFWFKDQFAKIYDGAEPIKRTLQKHGIKTDTPSTKTLIKSLIISAGTMLGVLWGIRIAENFISKAFRITNPTLDDGIWRDQIIVGLPIITSNGDELLIDYPNRKTKRLSGSFIQNWAYKGQWHTPSSLFNKLSKSLNTTEDRFVLDKGLGKFHHPFSHHSYNFFKKPWNV